MSAKLKSLQEAASAAAGRARAIAEKAAAEGRELTEAERSDYTADMAKGRDLLEQIKAVKAD